MLGLWISERWRTRPMCREPALNLQHCKKRQRKKKRRKHSETRTAKANVLPGNRKEWAGYGRKKIGLIGGLFIVTNTGRSFRQENMRNVNKVSRNRKRVFGNMTSDYMSQCLLTWVRSTAGITEGRLRHWWQAQVLPDHLRKPTSCGSPIHQQMRRAPALTLDKM